MMKKFLSSLLALTMILSLVIVPARANNDPTVTGATVSGKSDLTLNETTEYSVSLAGAKAGDVDISSGTNVTYKWTVSDALEITGDGANKDTQAKVSVKAKSATTASSKASVTCTITYTPNEGSAISGSAQKTGITVTDPQAAFEAAVKQGKVTYKGRDYSINSDKSVAIDLFNEDSLPTTGNGIPTISSVPGCSGTTLTYKNSKWVAEYTDGGKTLSCELNITASKVTPSITMKADNANVTAGSTINAVTDQKVALVATYSNADKHNASYSWTAGSLSTGTDSTYDFKATEPGNYTVTLKVSEGDDKDVATFTFTIKVDADPYIGKASGDVVSKKLATGETWEIQTPYIYNKVTKQSYTVSPSAVTWKSSNEKIAKVSSSGVVTAGEKSGEATITATITYNTKPYKVEYEVTVKALDVELKSIANGDYESYTDTEFARILASKIADVTDDDFKASDVTSVKLIDSDRYLTFTTDSSNGSETKNLYQDFRIKATKGYLGEQTFKVSVNDKYTVTLTVNVEGAGSTIKETVTGTSTSKEVTFTNSDYAYLYYSYSKPTYKDYFDGNKVSNFEGPVKEDKTVTVPASAFKDKSSVTLYVVGLDKYGVASTGTIEVSQKSYAIEYNVVAGETLSFDQKAFESFMNDYADDNIKTSKGDYFEFDYVKFTSLPNSTREGVLYEGKDKIKTSTEVENLDKVSFESVAKAKDTIKVPFTLYAKQYDKNDKVIDKKVSMTGEVVISVVKEDIVFEVGVNSAIKLGSDKFIDFLRDSDKSYKKADLDYVTFDVGKNSAITSYFNGTGALYRYYNGSTGINSTVSAKDEFYYNPKTSSKHYDLDDVTYVTSKFAKVGDIVYIPFTAYGTKSGQKAEGTLAIKVKQTMNFVDVRPGDYFYDSVQWAVNLDITKGTSATTFSPKQGCTRAQIVTFLWRAANSPAPRSSTNKFTDVYATTHADYMKAIIWATEQGITTGTGNGKFSPDATCTRAQIVTFLYRFKNNPAVYGSLNFSDVNKTEHAAFYNAILWAVNNKITTGYGNGIFDPNGTCNRGDAVTFLYRALA